MAASEVAGAALEGLARIVLSAQPLGATLTRVARIAAEYVPGVDQASLILVEHGRAQTVAFSGDLAVTLDERQYGAGFGPSLDAAVTGDTIAVENTADERVYPAFADQATRAGVTSTLSIGLPAVVPGLTGALNLYGRGPAFDPRIRRLATEYAGYAAVTVANAATHDKAVSQVRNLRNAMASRAVIEQAKGLFMATRHCTPDEAFDVLREASNLSNRRLRDIATELVEGTAPPAA